MNRPQAKLYRAIWERRHDPVSPTIEELRKAVGLASKSTVWKSLQTLNDDGWICIERSGRGKKRNHISLTGRRPDGFGEIFEGYMHRDASGHLPATFGITGPNYKAHKKGLPFDRVRIIVEVIE